jgi:hypothetical protein
MILKVLEGCKTMGPGVKYKLGTADIEMYLFPIEELNFTQKQFEII